MKLSSKSTLTFLALVPIAACGSDVLRFSDQDPLGPPSTGGENGSGDGDEGTGGDATGGGPSGGGNNGGTGGIVIDPPFGGNGGAGGAGPVNPPALIDGQSEITDLEATEDGLFWVEYGTYDHLGNFNRDGKLFYVAHSDTEPTLLAEDLHGPMDIAVTDDEIYMLIEESILISPGSRRELWRYDRESFEVDFVATGRGFLATHGADAYFYRASTGRHEIWALDDANPPELLLDAGRSISFMVADESAIFFSNAEDFYSLPHDGQVPLFEFAYPAFSYLNEYSDSLFALEQSNGVTYLVEAPKSGEAPWKRIEDLGSRGGQGLSMVGDRYFARMANESSSYTIVEGSVEELGQVRDILTFRVGRKQAPGKRWTCSRDFVYYTNAESIFRVEVPPFN